MTPDVQRHRPRSGWRLAYRLGLLANRALFAQNGAADNSNGIYSNPLFSTASSLWRRGAVPLTTHRYLRLDAVHDVLSADHPGLEPGRADGAQFRWEVRQPRSR